MCTSQRSTGKLLLLLFFQIRAHSPEVPVAGIEREIETYDFHLLLVLLQRQNLLMEGSGRRLTVNRDFKQRQRGRRRERPKVRENPKSPLRMTGGKRVNVLRSVPT